MTARYKVFLMPPAVADSKNVQMYLVENYSPEKADEWENGFLNTFLQGLSKVPHHKIVRPATGKFPLPVRCLTYRTTKKGAGYFVYFNIEEFQRPDPEPPYEFFAGIVRVIGIVPAAQAPLTEEEIDMRQLEK
jgi:hypothetical protein